MIEASEKQAPGPIAKLVDVIKDPGKAKAAVERYEKAEASARAAATVARKEILELQNLSKELDKNEKEFQERVDKETIAYDKRAEELRAAENSLKSGLARLESDSGKLHGARVEFRKNRDAEIARLEALRIAFDDTEKELKTWESKLKAREGNLKTGISDAKDLREEYDGKLAELRRIIAG